MDIFLPLGIIISFIVFKTAIPDLFTDLSSYLQPESLIMVAGGVFAAFIMMSNHKEITKIIKVTFSLIFPNKIPNPEKTVKKIILLSKTYHQKGRMELQGHGEKFDDGFLTQGIQMVIDKIEPDFIKKTLTNQIFETKKRHSEIIKIYKTLSSFAPMFGLIGTVTGVIQVLKNLESPEMIGPAMSLALLTTLYGLLFSTIIFLPIANKLKKRSEAEMVIKEMILEGVVLISKEEIPLKVERYLHAYLDSTSKLKLKKIKG